MIQLAATTIRLTVEDLRPAEELSHGFGITISDTNFTNLRPQAPSFKPHNSIDEMPFRWSKSTSSAVPIPVVAKREASDCSSNSMPLPSPHLDRYPVLVKPTLGRNTQVDDAMVALTPIIIDNLEAKIKRRAVSYAPTDLELAALHFEHSPLEQLRLDASALGTIVCDQARAELQQSTPEMLARVRTASVQSTFSLPGNQSRAGSSHSNFSLRGSPGPSAFNDYFGPVAEAGSPTAISIGLSPAHESTIVHRRTRTASVGVVFDLDKQLPPLPLEETITTLFNSPTADHNDQSTAQSERSLPDRRKTHRARVLSDPSASPVAVDTLTIIRQDRHSFPRNGRTDIDIVDQQHMYLTSRRQIRSTENDVFEQTESLLREREVWFARRATGADLEVTPPKEGRYERILREH
ncbi:hypothetical protein AMS68_003241 [Peltaster fructicola]|uniref:Uncharacterized protein n=1 Tax=Peltaster fructicola TaxID=286661 RepID=A0A6H0XSL3_9PEZI|nr:hypothetical protein AMS68_003241 [Peltaster fructicola]